MAGIIADAHRAEIAFVVALIGAAAGHRYAVALLLALLGHDVAPLDHTGPSVVDDGLIAHADTCWNVCGQAVAETVGIPGHLLLGADGRTPRVVAADDAVVGECRVDLVRVAVRRMVERLVVGAHRARKQTRIAHLVMRRLEYRLAVGSLVGNEAVVRVHADLLQQLRSA